MSITALCMFTNLFLVVLMLFADLPIPKFHFQLQKKRLEKSSGKGQTSYNLEDGVTALALSCTMIVHAFSTNDSACYIRTLL